MKKVIFISGTMGSGKSTVSRLCSEQLTRSVWLDGDWCWMMHPFQAVSYTHLCYQLFNIHRCSPSLQKHPH